MSDGKSCYTCSLTAGCRVQKYENRELKIMSLGLKICFNWFLGLSVPLKEVQNLYLVSLFVKIASSFTMAMESLR